MIIINLITVLCLYVLWMLPRLLTVLTTGLSLRNSYLEVYHLYLAGLLFTGIDHNMCVLNGARLYHLILLCLMVSDKVAFCHHGF